MGMTLVANGLEYSAWDSISVTAKMSAAARSFSLSLAEFDIGTLKDNYWLAPGDHVKVYADGIKILDGYVNKYKTSFNASGHSITISGRSKSQDSVDSSATHPTGRFENTRLSAIANTLAGSVGNSVSIDVTDPMVGKFQVNQGETITSAIDRLARAHGLVLTGQADGTMLLTKGTDKKRYKMHIGEGVPPVLSMSASISDAKRFSNYTFKSQMSGWEQRFGTDASGAIAEVADKAVKRYRPMVAVMEVSGGSQEAEKRAGWQAGRVAGANTKVDVVCQGFTFDGALWEPNKLIYVRSILAKIDAEMLVSECVYTQSGEGSKTSMKLVPPSAMGGSGKSASGSGDAAWGGKREVKIHHPPFKPIPSDKIFGPI